jgi:preprotein translocase subunit SecD
MVIRSTRFNIYLLCLALLAPAAGCRSPESRSAKQLATFRVHLEVNPDGTDRNQPVPIYRAQPSLVNVDKGPLLTEGDIAEARVISDTLNAFWLQIQFDPRGTLILEQYTAMYSGKRFAFFSEFGEKMEQYRWLGAPVIPRRISNGVLTFTPDATREEVEQIARGLNNVAIKNGVQAKPKTSKPEAK